MRRSTLERKVPLSREDCEEIQTQVDELVEAGWIEEYNEQDFPTYCSPTFLVEKDKGKTNDQTIRAKENFARLSEPEPKNRTPCRILARVGGHSRGPSRL